MPPLSLARSDARPSEHRGLEEPLPFPDGRDTRRRRIEQRRGDPLHVRPKRQVVRTNRQLGQLEPQQQVVEPLGLFRVLVFLEGGRQPC